MTLQHQLISHWPDIVIWLYITAREAGNCSLYFGRLCDQLKTGSHYLEKEEDYGIEMITAVAKVTQGTSRACAFHSYATQFPWSESGAPEGWNCLCVRPASFSSTPFTSLRALLVLTELLEMAVVYMPRDRDTVYATPV